MDQRIAAGAVIGFIAIAAIVFFLYQQQEAQPLEQDYDKEFSDLPLDDEYDIDLQPGNILETCGTQESQYLRDLCWLFEAGAELDAEKCLNIGERPVRIDCIRGIAVNYESDSAFEKELECGELYDVGLGQFFECIDALLPILKVEKLGICNQFLADEQTQLYLCKTDVAVELADYSICEMMPSNYRENCLVQVDVEDISN